MGAGSYFFLKYRAPRWGLASRLAFASGMGMIGSFFGFTIGGVGAALEIQTRMEDAPR